jgi:hypothetical protein
VVGGTHRGPLHAVVHAEEAQVGALLTPTRLLQHLREPFTYAATFKGKPGDCHPYLSYLRHLRLGTTEDVEVWVGRETLVRDS